MDDYSEVGAHTGVGEYLALAELGGGHRSYLAGFAVGSSRPDERA